MSDKKTILITGAPSGLGREAAVELSKDYNIILNGRNYEDLMKTKELCYNNSFVWQFDLADINNLEESLKDFINSNNLEIYGYVHCAGNMKMAPCKMISTESMITTFSVNVFSATFITKLLINKRINKDSLKSIVFISSNISNRGAKAFSVYGSSKAALNALMRTLAMELAPRIRVNSILPGAMKTKMTEDIFESPEKEQAMSKTYPLGIGRPQNIVPTIEFLLSDKSEWITGQEITIDGGRTINITE